MFSQQWKDETVESVWFDKYGEKIVTLSNVAAQDGEENVEDVGEVNYKLTMYKID